MRCAKSATAAVFLALQFSVARAAGVSSPLEDAVKATFIFKFAAFVSWPASTPDTRDFLICIAGSDGVSDIIAQTAKSQSIDDRPIAVRALAPGQAENDCRIFYVATSTTPDEYLDGVRGKPVLTITDGAGGSHGVIQLLTLDHHVRFDIDVKLANDDGLTISSKLLTLAHSVTPGSAP